MLALEIRTRLVAHRDAAQAPNSEQRQRAIGTQWRVYGKRGDQWTEYQKEELLIYSDFVYAEATGNKGPLKTYLLPGK